MDVSSGRGPRQSSALSTKLVVTILILCGLAKAVVSYAAATSSMAHTTATTFTLAALLASAATALSLHQPWLSKGRISERDVFRLLTVAFLTGLTACGTVYGLRTVGPARAGLLELTDVALVGGASYALGRTGKSTVLRGAVLALIGFGLVVWYDPSAQSLVLPVDGPIAHGGRQVGLLQPGAETAVLLTASPAALAGGPASVLPSVSGVAGGEGLPVAPSRDAGGLARPRKASLPQAVPVPPSPAADRSEEPAVEEASEEAPPAAVEEASGKEAVEEPSTEPPAFAKEGGSEEGLTLSFDEPAEGEGEGSEAAPAEEQGSEGGSGTGRRLLSASAKQASSAGEYAAAERVRGIAGKALQTTQGKPLARARKLAADAAKSVVTQTSKLRAVIERHERSSVLLGALLLAGCSWLDSVRRRMEKDLSADTGVSPRKLHATVLTTAALVWVPIAGLRWIVSSGAEAASVADAEAGGRASAAAEWIAAHSSPSLLPLLLVAGVYGFVTFIVCEYASDLQLFGGVAGGGGDALGSRAARGLASSSAGGVHASRAAIARADIAAVRLFSALLVFGWGVILARLTGWTSQFTLPLALGLAAFLPGIAASAGVDGSHSARLAAAIARGTTMDLGARMAGAGAGGSGSASSGAGLVGAVSGMLTALFSGEADRGLHAAFASSDGEGSGTPSKGVSSSRGGGDGFTLATARKVFRHIWEDTNSRKIFTFLTINFAFMFVEITVGWATNSLGLISDAGHMFFDNASLFIGLYASYMARWKRDEVFTYGYARYEVLAGFVNAIFLVFVAVSVVTEAMERLAEPPEIRGEHLLTVSCMGLGVNIIGLIFFHDHSGEGGGGHGHSHGGHGHSHGGGTNENMYGVYLHVMADALGSVGVIISSLLIQWYGWHLADPVASIAISLLILASVMPLITATIGPLLSRLPEEMEAGLAEALLSARRLPDVLSVYQVHFWKHHADVIVGTLHVTVTKEAEPQRVLRILRGIFTSAGVHDVTIQISAEGEGGPAQEGASGGLQVTVEQGGHGGDAHGHSHGGNAHGHSHGGDAHGHSHGGVECDGVHSTVPATMSGPWAPPRARTVA